MLPEVRSMLDQIDEMLAKKDRAAGDLAAILSALRGSDISSIDADMAKGFSTMPIRSIAFPKLADARRFTEEIWLDPAHTRCWSMTDAFRLKSDHNSINHSYHFKIHIDLAVEAINRTGAD